MIPQARAAVVSAFVCALVAGAVGAKKTDIGPLAGLVGVPSELKTIIARLVEQREADKRLFQGQIDELKDRVGRCEPRGDKAGGGPNDSSTFSHRQSQEQSHVCGMEAVQSMLTVCCAPPGVPPGIGHRLLTEEGCDSLPTACPAACSEQFIAIYEGCRGQPVLELLPPDQLARWASFYGQCVEARQAAAEVAVGDAQPAMIFHVFVIDDKSELQSDMFLPGGGEVSPLAPLRSSPHQRRHQLAAARRGSRSSGGSARSPT